MASPPGPWLAALGLFAVCTGGLFGWWSAAPAARSPVVASEGRRCHCQASQEHVTAVVWLSDGTWCLWIIRAVSSRLNVWTIFRWWYRRHAAGSGDVCTSGAHRVSGSPSRAEDPDSRLRLELCRSGSRACWNGPVYVLFTVYGYFLARKSGVYKYSHMLNLRSP